MGIPWEEDVMFPVGRSRDRVPEGLRRLRWGHPDPAGLGLSREEQNRATRDLPA